MDRISKLPDEVLCHILSFLSTKHAVATSILSSRWVYLWLSVPVIDLDDSVYLNPERKDPKSLLFVKFFDRVSSLNESETILKFRLRLHCNLDDSTHTLSDINGLIHNVFLRNIIEMDIKIYSYFFSDDEDELNYLKIPHSESLKVLRVRTRNYLKLPEFPGCFPSLRVFDAKCSVDYHDELITNMFPCSPALEKLCLVGDLTICTGEFNFNIGGPALKHLELELDICDYNECDALVVIDAPKLDYLWLKDGFMASYLVKHKPSITEVRLDLSEDSRFPGILYEVGPTRLTRFNKLLQGLVNTKFISVSASTLMVLFSQDWNIPVLPYLTKLELDVPACSWRLLLQWLQSCPDLKVLSLIIKEEPLEEFEEGSEEESEEVVPDVVPSCLSSCVKEIEIKRLGKEINRLGKVDEEEMLKYLLDNAKVLDKCTVDSRVYIRDGVVQDTEWRNNLLVYFGLDKCTVDSRAKTPNVTMQPLPT